ncbi:hypothetical protein CR513_54643, partial [Mucuna pruriens]
MENIRPKRPPTNEVLGQRVKACDIRDTVKTRPTRRYNANIFLEKLIKEDLVLNKALKDGATNKLTHNLEGPYRIIEEVRIGAFQLEHLDGRRVPRTWNSTS